MRTKHCPRWPTQSQARHGCDVTHHAERFSFYGMTAPFMNFMQNSCDDALRPGALGWGQARASQVSNVFYILTLLTPIAAA